MSNTGKDDFFKNDYLFTPFHLPSNRIVSAVADIQPRTLTITNCEKFKVQLRELDVEFELEPDKLENIDTLIINGYKYVKEKAQ